MTLPRPSRRLDVDESPAEKIEKSISYRNLVPKDFRPSDSFTFEPTSDISVFELAVLIKLLYEPAIHFKSFLDLEPHLQRHFRLQRTKA